jgi:hypothetical protein
MSKALIPSTVVASLVTIFTFIFFMKYSIPDENDLMKMLLDTVYGAFRPLTSGTFGQILVIASEFCYMSLQYSQEYLHSLGPSL